MQLPAPTFRYISLKPQMLDGTDCSKVLNLSKALSAADPIWLSDNSSWTISVRIALRFPRIVAAFSSTSPKNICCAGRSCYLKSILRRTPASELACLTRAGLFARIAEHRSHRWGVVQPVGHLTVNEDGEGSNPSAPANFSL
jgi:hypothetical protein